MNSWDRMPFLTTIASGGAVASYSPAHTETTGMFIIANYGSSQGYDNDDGSNYEYIHHNFFYQADGLKMCVGGARRRSRTHLAHSLSHNTPRPTPLLAPTLRPPGTMGATTLCLTATWSLCAPLTARTARCVWARALPPPP